MEASLRAEAALALAARFATASEPVVEEVHVGMRYRPTWYRNADGTIFRRTTLFRVWEVRVDGEAQFKHLGERSGYMPVTPEKK